jgi:DNA-binding transcriptional regulator YiaG
MTKRYPVIGDKEAEAESRIKLESSGEMDLKEFIKSKLNSGWSKQDLARYFSVSRHTVTNWMEKRKIRLAKRARAID